MSALLLAQPALAHEESEITSTARLQHNRLEVAAIMTVRAAGALLEESSDPEFDLRPGNFETYRGQLQSAAMRFFEIADGRGTLTPLQATVALPEPGHLRFTVVYPQPSSWPLKFRPGNVGHLPTNAINDLGVYDQGEKLLGASVLSMREASASELSVTPAAIVPPLAAPVPIPLATTASDAQPETSVSLAVPSQPLSWASIALGLAVGLGMLVFLALIRKRKTSPSP